MESLESHQVLVCSGEPVLSYKTLDEVVAELDEDDAVLLALATPKIARLVKAVEAVLVDGRFTPDGTYRTSAHALIKTHLLCDLRIAVNALREGCDAPT